MVSFHAGLHQEAWACFNTGISGWNSSFRIVAGRCLAILPCLFSAFRFFIFTVEAECSTIVLEGSRHGSAALRTFELFIKPSEQALLVVDVQTGGLVVP